MEINIFFVRIYYVYGVKIADIKMLFLKQLITDNRGAMQTWHVYKSAKVPADGFAKIVDEIKDNALALITCEDESPDGGYLNRRVVLAEL